MVDVTCPASGCGHKFEAEVDVPDPLPGSAAISPEALQNILAQRDKDKELAAELASSRALIEDFMSGARMPPTEKIIEHVQACPDCASQLRAAMKPQLIANLTGDEAKAIAKNHRLWPPPSIDLTGFQDRIGMK